MKELALKTMSTTTVVVRMMTPAADEVVRMLMSATPFRCALCSKECTIIMGLFSEAEDGE
jgi:hypothetical protein